MQWTAAHIHLAEHHDHDGSLHQHSIEAHTHQLTSHHADTIDSSHQPGNFSVVELDHEFNTSKGKKQEKPSTAAITLVFQQLTFSQPIALEFPEIINTKLSYHGRSSVRLRAPPQHP